MKEETYKRKIKTWERKHHVITAILVGFALIIFWRGVWMLSDLYLFPDNPTLSAVISIVTGILILYLRDFDLREVYENEE